MFNNQKELKDFILWCKSQKVKSFKNDNTEFVLSDLAIAEQLIADSDEPELDSLSSKLLTDTDPEQESEDEDLLYWSTN